MSTQNQFEKDAKVSTTLKDDAAESSEKKELTDSLRMQRMVEMW